MLGGLAVGFAQMTKPSPTAQGLPRDGRSRREARRRLRRLRR
jgi:hypothetical protein